MAKIWQWKLTYSAPLLLTGLYLRLDGFEDVLVIDGTAGRLIRLVMSGRSFCIFACFFLSSFKCGTRSGSATSNAV